MSTRHTNKRKGRYFLCLSDGKERQKGPLLQALVYTSRPLQSAGRLSDSKGQWILLEQGMHCCSRTLETALPLFALHPFYARVAGGCFHMRVLSSTRQQRRKWGAGRAPHTPPRYPLTGAPVMTITSAKMKRKEWQSALRTTDAFFVQWEEQKRGQGRGRTRWRLPHHANTCRGITGFCTCDLERGGYLSKPHHETLGLPGVLLSRSNSFTARGVLHIARREAGYDGGTVATNTIVVVLVERVRALRWQ